MINDKADINPSEVLQIRVIAELILSHLNDLQDTFESTMGTKENAQLEINMFHAINDLASSLYQTIEQSDFTGVRFRKKIIYDWEKYSKLCPLPYENEDVNHKNEIDAQNKIISDEIVAEFKKPIYRNRWNHVIVLINEIKFYRKFHRNN